MKYGDTREDCKAQTQKNAKKPKSVFRKKKSKVSKTISFGFLFSLELLVVRPMAAILCSRQNSTPNKPVGANESIRACFELMVMHGVYGFGMSRRKIRQLGRVGFIGVCFFEPAFIVCGPGHARDEAPPDLAHVFAKLIACRSHFCTYCPPSEIFRFLCEAHFLDYSRVLTEVRRISVHLAWTLHHASCLSSFGYPVIFPRLRHRRCRVALGIFRREFQCEEASPFWHNAANRRKPIRCTFAW
jgi:hypothetical protein